MVSLTSRELSNFSRGNKRIKPVLGWRRKSAYLALSSSEGARKRFSRTFSSARLDSICLRMSSRDCVCEKLETAARSSVAKIRVAIAIFFIGNLLCLVSQRGEISVRLRANWPDPGLCRNTRCRCSRCSVPGLAGFTRRAVCGARDLINLRCKHLAERVGFEPTERFPVHSISSAASSTTPAPLPDQPQKSTKITEELF